MKLLGIETSCDETSVCVMDVDDNGAQLQSHVIVSQAKMHEKYGGVVPEIAAREHVKTLVPALIEVGVTPHTDIDTIAVTSGPGLIAALMIGVEAAKTLAWLFKKPLIKVNHIEGHIYSPFIDEPFAFEFPYLALIVSGGHTELIMMRDHGEYELVGRTVDDAVGEAFDKVAKLLKLPYPGGPQVSARARQGDSRATQFPRPMMHQGYSFSFSGLKTAVLREWERQVERARVQRGEDDIDDAVKQNICASFQEAAIDVLVYKTIKAAQELGVRNIIVGGGVAANELLRTQLSAKCEEHGFRAYISPRAYTGDNAAMIACAGYFHARKKEFVDPFSLEADAGWELV